MSAPPRLRLGRDRSLRGQGAFKRVLDGRARVETPDFALHMRPNDGRETRLGISIGRRFGCAARRNRVRRLLREAFRLSQAVHPHGAPAPYDIVIVVRPHEARALEAYRAPLVAAMEELHAVWSRRAARRATEPQRPPEDGAA
ncbi:MAG: ribonuclease P protein component [Phycisphaera sp.]|nr:ribonuclease P protein component [Phycisphaera sp.]